VDETVTISGALTADGAAVPVTGASAIIRQPDGSVEMPEMIVNGNQAELKISPSMSGIYGVEVNVLANSVEGNVIDRAAFLTFEVEPTSMETAKNQITALVLVAALFVVILALILLRRRTRVSR
jgi:hypothetical protein